MKNCFGWLLLLFFTMFMLVYIMVKPASAEEPRYAACDLCGYCPPNPAPQSWTKCAACLYPEITDPESNQTLIVDPQTNNPPTPFPGNQYTMLGCLSTQSFFGGGGLTEEEGQVGGVVQKLLNIVFSIVGGLAFLSLLYGSFVVLTSQASPDRLIQGKKIIYGAIIGVVFSLSSVFIVNLLASGILKIPGFNAGP